MYHKNVLQKDIAKHFKTHESSISILIKKLNLPKRERKKIKEIDLKEFKEMYSNQVTIKEMMEYFNTTSHYIHLLIKELNLPNRKNTPAYIIKLSNKKVSFERLAKTFSARTIPPYGECLVIPEIKFNKCWIPSLEKEGYQTIFVDGNNSCFLVRKS